MTFSHFLNYYQMSLIEFCKATRYKMVTADAKRMNLEKIMFYIFIVT